MPDDPASATSSCRSATRSARSATSAAPRRGARSSSTGTTTTGWRAGASATRSSPCRAGTSTSRGCVHCSATRFPKAGPGDTSIRTMAGPGSPMPPSATGAACGSVTLSRTRVTGATPATCGRRPPSESASLGRLVLRRAVAQRQHQLRGGGRSELALLPAGGDRLAHGERLGVIPDS